MQPSPSTQRLAMCSVNTELMPVACDVQCQYCASHVRVRSIGPEIHSTKHLKGAGGYATQFFKRPACAEENQRMHKSGEAS